MPFEKLESQNKTEHIVSQILKEIKAGVYRVGDKLPPELEISQMLGVSRPIIREALSALRLVGILETKKGQGTYVNTNKWATDNEKERFLVPAVLDHGVNTFELLEARRIIEPAVAQLALEMMDEENVTKIHNGIQGMEEAENKKDYHSFHEANKKFHYAIVETTRNTSLINYVRSLLDLFTESDFGIELRRRYLTGEKYIWESIEIHRSIYENLKSRNKRKLQEAFIEHFDQVEKQLLGR